MLGLRQSPALCSVDGSNLAHSQSGNSRPVVALLDSLRLAPNSWNEPKNEGVMDPKIGYDNFT